MNNLNSILVEGKIASKPELIYTPKGTAVCTFAVSSDRFNKGEDDESTKETSVFDIETRARLAEICVEYLRLGRGVRIVGRLAQKMEGEHGSDYSHVWIVAEHVEFRPETKNAKTA